MKSLGKLTIKVRIITEPEVEVERAMQVCNACRYCEGSCAVFPAVTQRLALDKADINYLVSLCYNCGACLHTRQYASPHEFTTSVPKAMVEVRLETHQHYAQLTASGNLYHRAGMTTVLALVGGLILFLLLVIGLKGSLLHSPLVGDFYQIFPYNPLAWVFGSVFVLAFDLLMIGVIRSQREISPGQPRAVDITKTLQDTLTLKYLNGGHGKGCDKVGDASTPLCRRFHRFTFYGSMLCFAAIMMATGYRYLAGQEAPYPFFSFPVLLGTLDGIGLLVEPAGLLWLNLRRPSLHGDVRQKPIDRGFILLPLLTSFTGLALLAGQDTSWMDILLAVHLGVVTALFLTLPCGKFAHGSYRCAALLKWAIEKWHGKQAVAAGD